MIIVTVTFGVAYFHRYSHTPGESPGEELIQDLIASLEGKIAGGLGFNKGLVDRIDYERLERRAAETVVESLEQDGLLRAVAGAVAEAGPWNASMDMVARRSGLSKSGLYAHFRNKQDMLRQLFMTEFQRMATHAEACVRGSSVPEEQFYLAIIGIAGYLRSRPEILIAVDWLRTRRLDLGLSVPPGIYKLFSDIRIPGTELSPAAGPLSEEMVQWILFLIVNTLMRRPADTEFAGVTNESFRILYRFVGLGVEGFNR
ncbi:MAG: TetR/AcrR family transcriptional regulator [Spirochaetaceae bacterium]|nr:TetR/AcrR family transcriptional regulator [Spirochaetaceae bacterium]